MGALARTSSHHLRNYNAWRFQAGLTGRLGSEYLAYSLQVFVDLPDCAKIQPRIPSMAERSVATLFSWPSPNQSWNTRCQMRPPLDWHEQQWSDRSASNLDWWSEPKACTVASSEFRRDFLPGCKSDLCPVRPNSAREAQTLDTPIQFQSSDCSATNLAVSHRRASRSKGPCSWVDQMRASRSENRRLISYKN